MFKNGKVTGLGLRTEIDHTTKRGNFSNGKLSGFGVVNLRTGKVTVKSYFVDEEPTDFIHLTKGSASYIGEFKDGETVGLGQTEGKDG